MGHLEKSNEIHLQTKLVGDPFEKWALDFIGNINPPSHLNYYILFFTNYVPKWVEVKALLETIDKIVVKLQGNIC